MPEVLLVCTANICRSPMAAVLLDAYLQAHAPVDAGPVRVTSAGVRAREGEPAAAPMVAIADRWGLDLHSHRSRPVTPERARQADLVATMERTHRDAVARMGPGLPERTFTLPELAALVPHVVPDPADGAPAGLAALVAALHRARARVWTDVDDVADPYGGPRAGYDVTATALLALVDQAGPALATSLRSGAGSDRAGPPGARPG